MKKSRLILLTTLAGDGLDRLAAIFQEIADITVASDLAALEAALLDGETTLLSFGAGVIVPGRVLSALRKPAYNMHAASPAFPGRDPHHHAVYRQATVYGATLHVMTPRVDDGPIIGVELFEVAPGSVPAVLLAEANEAGFRLVERLAADMLKPHAPEPLAGVTWGETKTRRSDLHEFCRLTPLINRDEFQRRYQAFNSGAFNNLTVKLHGQIFRIERPAQPPIDGYGFSEFTEGGFRQLLKAVKAAGYRFARYGDRIDDRHVIWRHDVDFSMHRAARLAEIEAEEGATATYFVNPRCPFYNLLEPEIAPLLDRIRGLGHEIGLHFDTSAYGRATWSAAELERALSRERSILELILGETVKAFSWHDPSASNVLGFNADEIDGMFNAYSASLQRNYTYCSDSNGYWRFQPMADVIAAGHPRLHLLTHPEWWTPEPLPPSERIDRAILGRAQAVRRNYDAQLARGGRRNISK